MQLTSIRRQGFSATPSAKRTQGETLIEVIIATLIFAIGILGNLGLQSASVQNNKSSMHQTKAILAANDMAERIRANRGSAGAGSYAGYSSKTPPTNPGCDLSPCSGNQLTNYDLFDWSQHFTNVREDDRFVSMLPGGNAAITYNAAQRKYTITISWIEQAYEAVDAKAQRADRTRNHSLVLSI